MSLSRSEYVDLAGGNTDVHGHLSDSAFLGQILRFERELATAAGHAGMLDGTQVATAHATIDGHQLDTAAISAESASGANPAIPIVKALKAIDPTGIHPGATSQDAIDTALVLCLRQAGQPLLAQLNQVQELLAGLAIKHRDTKMIGRTLGQQATPTTFGTIAAGWLEGVAAGTAELEEALAELPVQYGGATGTLAATHPRGLEIHRHLAAQLELKATPIIWHTNRFPLIRVATALAATAGAVRKIAGDVIWLSATEIGEVREPSPGGSSAMPHKANPAAAVACDGYARRTPGLAATMLDAMDSRHQRGVGSWHAEWPTIRELTAATASAVARIHASLDGITVDRDAMTRNLEAAATGDQPTGHTGEMVDAVIINWKEQR